MSKRTLRSFTAVTMTILMLVSLFAPAAVSYAAEEAVVEQTADDTGMELDAGEATPDQNGTEGTVTPDQPAPEIEDLGIRIVASPVNPATKVYKNGKAGKFKVIFSGEWISKSIDEAEKTKAEAATEEEEKSAEPEEDPAVTKGQEIFKALTDAGWTFRYVLQDAKGNIIEENIDIEEGYTYVIPKKNTGVKLVAYAEKAGETTREFVSEVTEKIVWTVIPKKVKAEVQEKSNNVKVTWSKVENASGYYIYRIATKKRKPKTPIAYVSLDKGRKFIDENLPGKKTYYYYVKSVYLGYVAGKSYHTSSALSTSVAKATVDKYLRIPIRPIGWHTTIRGDATLFDGKTGGASHGTIKSGLKVEVTEKYPAKFEYGKHPYRIYIKYKKNGKVVKQGWIGYSHAKGGVFGTVAYKNKKALDWTTERKENFVNNKGYSSPTKYLIWVSTYTQRVNIFKGRKGHWKLYKSNRCVTGTFLHSTKIGSGFSIWKHKKTRVRYFYQSTSQYYYHNLSYFSKGNSFHTVCWRVGSNRQVNFIKKTLQPGTRGCCRMYTPDATWIYNNIPMKTKVVVR